MSIVVTEHWLAHTVSLCQCSFSLFYACFHIYPDCSSCYITWFSSSVMTDGKENEHKNQDASYILKSVALKLGNLMTHCISNGLVTSKTKSVWKCGCINFHTLCVIRHCDLCVSKHVGGGFFPSPVGQRAAISQAAVKGRAGSHPFFKMVTSSSPRASQRCERKGPVLQQKTASWLKALNKLKSQTTACS